MIAAFLFKALFGLAVNLFQTRFSFSVAHRLSGQMWSYHFSQSLERMRGTDSGRILSEINGWPLQFANAFMVGGLMMVNEISVITLIAIGLLVYNPVVFLSIAIASLDLERSSFVGPPKRRLSRLQRHSTPNRTPHQHPHHQRRQRFP